MTDRRGMMKIVAAGGVAGLAGCAGNDGGGDGEDDDLGNTLVGPDGEPVTLKFVYRTGTETGKTTAQFMKQELGKIGIGVEFDSAPFNTLLDRYASNKPEGGEATFNGGDRDESVSAEPWDLLWGIGFNTYPMTPTSIAPFFIDERKTDRATINFYGYRPSGDRDVAAEIDELAQETDAQKRQAGFADLFGFISEDQPFGMIGFGDDIWGFRSDVKHTETGFNFGWDYQKWHFEGSASSPRGEYIHGETTDASTLNFVQISDEPSSLRVGLTMDGAYTVNSNMEVEPRWVEAINTEDKQTYEFKLRENLRWSDPYGQMTAEDWVYFITEVRQAEENWAGDTNRGDWFAGEEPIPVEQTGEFTFEVRLPEVDPDFPRKPIMWGAYCMPKELIEPYVEEQDGEGLNKDEEVRTLAYTGNLGPYKYESWERESRFRAVRNDDYYLREVEGYENAPLFERYAYQVFSEESTQLSALETGEITQAELPSEKADKFKDMNNVNVTLSPTPYISVLAYNQRANGWEPFREPEVRRAFAYAINKKAIAEQINRGYVTPAHTYQPEWSDWFDNSKVTRTGVGDSHSYARAKQLIDEALDDYEYVDQ
ncbi:ABC transporter substrate-binding protein [Halegenticoccus soli]|uniref:ABC transporter substrate-binding protein n=1 Tax=Halegenticoccus soli TaxID=1985678 RepID=UPI001E577E4E|nr:ABC transporter substrate-binding protein [Halegenticoccus soli]